MKKIFGIFLSLVFTFSALATPEIESRWIETMKRVTSKPVETKAAAPLEGWSDLWDRVGVLPIQLGGRVMPIEAFARQNALKLVGKSSYQEWNPVEWMLSLGAKREYWREQKILKIERQDFKRQVGLDEKTLQFSPKDILNNAVLIQYVSLDERGSVSQAAPIEKAARPDPRKQALYKLIDQLTLLGALENGSIWLVRPTSKIEEPWGSLLPEQGVPPQDDLAKSYLGMFLSYYLEDRDQFSFFLSAIENDLKNSHSNHPLIHPTKLKLEQFYLSVHPFRIAWILYLVSVLGWVWLGFSKGKSNWPLVSFTLGFVTQIFGMAMRSFVAGRPPVTNMYESIVWVSFGVIFFAWVLYLNHRKNYLLQIAGLVSVVALILSDAAPTVIDPNIHELVPVLRSNYWLTIHVLTITISYAAFALALGIGNSVLLKYARGYHLVVEKNLEIRSYIQQMYRALQFGVVLLALGTILGGVWADYSWGRFWGWDPKEVWALIALLGYLVILHARYTGWMKDFGFTVWTVIAFTLVVMAWYGVNFVLGVGLHSYGFSTGGQGTVSLLILLQLSFVLFASIRVKGLKNA